MNQQFSTLYSQLNAAQRDAVDSLDGPVFVFAGPGTGKTHVLSTRILNILQKTDMQPHNILCLTFTSAGAKNMQQRLASFLGAQAYGVKMTTFHSFCTEVIESHQGLFPLSPRVAQAISDIDRVLLMEEIFKNNSFPLLSPAKQPLYNVGSCLQLITSYKREGYRPLDIRKIAADELVALDEDESLTDRQRKLAKEKVQKNEELAEVFALYEAALRERSTYDYEDMILWVRDALRDNPELLEEYQEMYQYVLVDEFQDTNQSQLQVLEQLLSHWGDRANIFVVGDPHQSIYRFQGASLSNTFRFFSLYPNAKVVALEEGYRCGQIFYDTAAAVIQNNSGSGVGQSLLEALSQPLKAQAKKDGVLQCVEAPSTLAECVWLARKVQELHESGTAYSEIAILFRKHKHGNLLQYVFERMGIPYSAAATEGVLDQPIVLQFLDLLRLIVSIREPGQEKTLILPVLQQKWWNLHPTDVLTIVREASQNKKYHQNPWELLQDTQYCKTLKLENWEALHHFVDKIIEWQHLESSISLSELCEQILRDSGLYAHFWEDQQALSEVVVLRNFLREIFSSSQKHKIGGLSEFLQRIATMEAHGMDIARDQMGLTTDKVQFVTAHQAKGQEWKVVFLLHFQKGYWGDVKGSHGISPLQGTVPYLDLEKGEKNEDERRLLYVALTRAKEQLYISWSNTEAREGKVNELMRSQFFYEIPEKFTSDVLTIESKSLEQSLRQFFAPLDEVSQPYWHELNRQWLQEVVEQYSVSVSALNEYLECPVSFVYRRLIRVPTREHEAMVLGTAAHAALEDIYRALDLTGVVPPLESVYEKIDGIVRKSSLPENDGLKIAARVKTILSQYAAATSATWKPALFLERYFGGSAPVVFEGLPLVGKIDRIDSIDSTLGTVRVIDYKTSKPKSRNDIMGKNKNGDASYYRQLLFYKILGELDPSFSLHITEGEFLFLEQNPSGKYISERFDLTGDSVEELKETLRIFKKELYGLEFLDKKPCGVCETCRLLGLQKADVIQSAEQMAMF